MIDKLILSSVQCKTNMPSYLFIFLGFGWVTGYQGKKPEDKVDFI
jgi:hypothetical protein